MLDRAMKVVTGMSEGITEEELEEYKSIASLRNRSSLDAMARLQDRNKKKEPKVIEIPKGTQLDLFKKAAGESVEESLTEEQFDEKAGEKDACYRKVKSRYKVWPSAYASGALTKCRKVGAANWGNSKKKSCVLLNYMRIYVTGSAKEKKVVLEAEAGIVTIPKANELVNVVIEKKAKANQSV